MSWTDILTESTAALAPSGNPLEILPPRERAVLVLLGSGLDATTVAKLLHVSRETLDQDRRRAWQAGCASSAPHPTLHQLAFLGAQRHG